MCVPEYVYICVCLCVCVVKCEVLSESTSKKEEEGRKLCPIPACGQGPKASSLRLYKLPPKGGSPT